MDLTLSFLHAMKQPTEVGNDLKECLHNRGFGACFRSSDNRIEPRCWWKLDFVRAFRGCNACMKIREAAARELRDQSSLASPMTPQHNRGPE
jgi:hypothetical protein